LRRRSELKRQIEGIFRKEGKKLGSLNYIFCSDKELLKINQKFLNHDYYTDIITFDLSEKSYIIGEVYISADRVRENAKRQDTTIISELRRVIFHGALHLCGYKDKTERDKRMMRDKEEQYLKFWGQ